MKSGDRLPALHLQVGEVLVDRQLRAEQAADLADVAGSTPIRNATGENSQPKIVRSDRSSGQLARRRPRRPATAAAA